jgi:hypothetical protein
VDVEATAKSINAKGNQNNEWHLVDCGAHNIIPYTMTKK